MHRTSEEVKGNYVAVMGQELGTQFAALWQEVADLNLKWNEYLEFFATNPERVAMLNRAAPGFFGRIQDTLWKEILLHIARLTDPSESGKNKKI